MKAEEIIEENVCLVAVSSSALLVLTRLFLFVDLEIKRVICAGMNGVQIGNEMSSMSDAYVCV